MGAPKLSEIDIRTAIRILDQWQGKLTWDRYLALLGVELGHVYTKVAMLKQKRIRLAWEAAKNRVRESVAGVGHGDVAVSVARHRIEALSSKVARLEAENHQLLEQFVLWAHNASRMGMTKKDLDRPLPIILNRSRRVD